MESNSFEEALACYDKAIELKRDYADAYSNRGIAFSNLKRYVEALQSYDKAIKLNHDLADSHLNKSLILLLLRDFEHGWPEYEWRWKSKQKKSIRNFTQPLWLGVESLLNKTILLHAEQGLGDTIQFCRYTVLVKELGARILLEVPKSLMALFIDLAGVDELIETGKQLPDFDFHCPLLSLPLAFKTKLVTIPFPQQYLKANQNKINQWRKRINPGGLKVGLVWSGGFRAIETESSSIFERRNIPLKIFAQKLQSQNINFFSLQKGDPAESEIRGHEKTYWPQGNFFNYADELSDFSDTAALIANLDLIIAVDTSTAHLAGALGKPTWILNRFDSCWRWMLDRDDSPWYQSVKLYRQDEGRQWEPVLDRVVRDLTELNKSFNF
jgi:tetratricopeptide (TPR) repeat protein